MERRKFPHWHNSCLPFYSARNLGCGWASKKTRGSLKCTKKTNVHLPFLGQARMASALDISWLHYRQKHERCFPFALQGTLDNMQLAAYLAKEKLPTYRLKTACFRFFGFWVGRLALSCFHFQEKAKREAEEAAKKQRKPGQKRKGLGGLSPEKKRLLKVSLLGTTLLLVQTPSKTAT